ncbi:NAD-dependent epimerase/dehydratase family protein [Streptomyces sp. NPDC057877]|uniref:NAD-dependent epimerase/dehydratase family protein n=1 Tax=Streptomyces sp. NPDC057877 TaxID=3346269 RepID=UPI0036C77CB4
MHDPTLPSRVLRLVNADGNEFFAKQHSERDRYLRELHAYLVWGAHLIGHAPRVVGRQDTTCTLLLTAVPGVRARVVAPGSSEEEQLHYEAGRVLAKLHHPTSVPRTGAVGTELAQRLRDWTARAERADLISTVEVDRLNHHADVVANTLLDSAVCHLDYQPRNWLLGDSFGLCDFEHMRRDARIRDFARLEFRRWQAAPSLRTAFFAGYGRPLNDTEQRLLESFGAIEAVTALVRGQRRARSRPQHPRPDGSGPPRLGKPPSPVFLETSVSQHPSNPTTAVLRRAVVTGAAGFIGSHLAHALAQTGATVIGVDRRNPATDPTAALNLAPLQGTPGYMHVTADLLSCAIEPLLIDANAVFHLAGIPGVRPSWGPRFSEYVASNVLATHRVMDAAARMGVPRVVVASSSSVYGPTDGGASVETDRPRPASPYAVTKLAEEQLCLAHSAQANCPTSVVALRYFTVYGPRQRPDMFTHLALTAALTGRPLRLYGDGHQRRDFTYIDDAVTATIAAATTPAASGVINVGGGSSASLLEVINIANSLAGREIQIHQENPHRGDVPTTRANPTHAQEALGWQPQIDLHSGMRAQMQALVSESAAYGPAA